MKKKKILIVHSTFGSIESSVGDRIMFEKILLDLTEEGRTVKAVTRSTTHSRAIFNDGSEIVMTPIGKSILGRRQTHVYIHDSIRSMKNGELMIEELYKPCLSSFDDSFDITGDRICTYKVTNSNTLEIEKY